MDLLLKNVSNIRYIKTTDIEDWERFNRDKLNILFKKFINFAKRYNICDQASYDDFVELIYNNSNKVKAIPIKSYDDTLSD